MNDQGEKDETKSSQLKLVQGVAAARKPNESVQFAQPRAARLARPPPARLSQGEKLPPGPASNLYPYYGLPSRPTASKEFAQLAQQLKTSPHVTASSHLPFLSWFSCSSHPGYRGLARPGAATMIL